MNMVCNGYKFDQESFSPKAIEKMRGIYRTARTEFEINPPKDGYYYFGSRFHSFDAIVSRIQSATDEESFLQNSYEWVWAALKDCAGADHYYTFEKQWEI